MTVNGYMRLGSFPALRAETFDDLEGMLAGKGLRAERTGPGEISRINTAYRDGWYLAHMDYEMALRITAPEDRDDYTLYVPVAGAVQTTDGRDSIDCNGARTVMTSPHRPLVTQTAANASRVNLTVKRETIRRHLTVLLGYQPVRLPTFALSLNRERPETRAFFSYLWGVIDAVDQDAGFLDRPFINTAVEQTLITGLLLTQPHDFSGQLAQMSAGPAPADVKRAVDFIHAHLGDDITLADLARIARVPARTLQTHFQAHFGCGPIRYLRDQRLEQAREELRCSDQLRSVTEVALRWGFGNPGRFACAYRARFGEAPSQTRRRSHH